MSDTGTLRWFRVGGIADIPARGARVVTCGTEAIALFRTSADKVYALRDSCPHRGGPLSQGIVHGDCVTCPLHDWVIRLDTGEARAPDEGRTERFPVRIEDGSVLLGLPDALGRDAEQRDGDPAGGDAPGSDPPGPLALAR